jgi:ketosteroid isomerase-like protein
MVGQATAESGRVVVDRMYELFNRRRFEEMLDLVASDLEWDWSRSLGPEEGVVYGPEGLHRFLSRHLEIWESIEMVPEEIIEAGEDFVVFVHVRLRGRDGIEVEARGPHVATIRGGQLMRYRLFQTRDEALAAVDL